MKKLFALLLLTGLTLAGQGRKVVLMERALPSGAFTASEIEQMKRAAPGLRLVVVSADKVKEEIADAEGVVGPLDRRLLAEAKQLKWLQVPSAGVESYLSDGAFKSGPVVLTNGKIVQGPEIADHAMALLLALTRQINRSVLAKTTESWDRNQSSLVELRGKTAVVIGAGGIGTQIAVRAHAFGMKVYGVDPKDAPLLPFIEKMVTPDRLDEVLPLADVVFVAAPHTAQSEKMMGPKQFSLMKRNGYFIAVSRGKIYDMPALVQALDSKYLAGAGVDVTDPEPLPKGHPLWKFDNVVITPHAAGRSDGENARFIELYTENLRRFDRGMPLLHVVDKQRGF
jgi:phosphoglycerate dehydrogenase-like enzyme